MNEKVIQTSYQRANSVLVDIGLRERHGMIFVSSTDNTYSSLFYKSQRINSFLHTYTAVDVREAEALPVVK